MVQASRPRAGATPGRWLIRREPRPDAEWDLYCFAHAGGSPGEYARWSDDLPGVRVSAVQPPGRGSRMAERPFTLMRELVHAVVAAVEFRRPFALFGHSLGGLVAFEVARALSELGRERPERLFVSSAPPPPPAAGRRPIHRLPDDRLLEEIERRWGPLPTMIRSDPNFLALALGCFRADIQVFETYGQEFRSGDALDCPITALVGEQETGELSMSGWRDHTRAGADLHVLPGGHFYLREQRREVLDLVRRTMSRRYQ